MESDLHNKDDAPQQNTPDHQQLLPDERPRHGNANAAKQRRGSPSPGDWSHHLRWKPIEFTPKRDSSEPIGRNRSHTASPRTRQRLNALEHRPDSGEHKRADHGRDHERSAKQQRSRNTAKQPGAALDQKSRRGCPTKNDDEHKILSKTCSNRGKRQQKEYQTKKYFHNQHKPGSKKKRDEYQTTKKKYRQH